MNGIARKLKFSCKIGLVTLSLACLNLTGGEKSKSGPEITIPICKTAPVVDGKLNDAAWKSAAHAGNFYIVRDKDGKQSDDTEVMLTRNSKWLYLAFKCKNEKLRDVELKHTEHDSGVFRDDSVEIFLDPGADGKLYYHYKLNFGNAKGDQKVTVKEGKDAGWNIPWRSAVKIIPDGWNAEIAIPMSNFSGQGNLAKARINLTRNKVNPQYDQMQAKVSESTVSSSWAPVWRGFHEPKSFGKLKGFDAGKIESAFLPEISGAEVKPYKFDGGKRFYEVDVKVRNSSMAAGKVCLTVLDKTEDGKPTEASESAKVNANGIADVRIKVPVESVSPRKVTVCLKAPGTGEILDSFTLKDTSALALMTIPLLERDYYTDEKDARIRCCFGMPEKSLKKMTLTVKAFDGKVLKTAKKLKRKNIIGFPITNIAVGKTKLKIELCESGRILDVKTIELTKKKPNPGCEVKVDQFNNVLLKDGKPLFVYGILMSHYRMVKEKYLKAVFEEIVKANFNTIQIWSWEVDIDKIIKLAEKHNVYLMDFITFHLPKYSKRDIFSEDFMKIHKNTIRKFRNCKRFLAYQTVDEPNLGSPARQKKALEAVKTLDGLVQKYDGYHPTYLLFARSIVPECLNYCRIVSYDIYMYGGIKGFLGSTNFMTRYTTKLKKELEGLHKVMFIVPSSGYLDPVRTPRMITPMEQRSQTYLAVIHGAKGILYFNSLMVSDTRMWETFSILGKQFKELGPAIVGDQVEQKISYSPVGLSPVNGRYPDVQAALFRHPDGRYILMAASSKDYPSETTFTVKGLNVAGKVKGMFINKSFNVKNDSFSEKIEAYGTRGYDLGKLKLSEPVEISIIAKSFPREKIKEVKITEKLHRQGCKNFMSNPDLSDIGTPGCPRFVSPYRLTLSKQIGKSGCGWELVTDNPRFGKHCLRIDRSMECWGALFSCHPPVYKKKVPVVLSFYARGKNGGEKVFFLGRKNTLGDGDLKGKTFNLSKEWKRCVVKGMLNPPPNASFKGRYFYICPGKFGETVYVDGFQLELGNKASKFTTK